MTTLHDRLADLAEQAPTGPAAPDLWRTGRRRAPRRRAAVAVGVLAATAVVAVGSAAVVTRVQAVPQPSGTPTRIVLPDKFFEPSSRLPVAREPGRLLAVVPGQHSSWIGSTSEGLVGISATTQRYTFLDLPGWRSGSQVERSWALSADGRYLAYWYADHDRPTDHGPGPADGIAVLDAMAGTVKKHDFDSAHGVDPAPIGWAKDALFTERTDLMRASPTGTYSQTVGAVTWELPGGTVREVDDPHELVQGIVGPAGVAGFLASTGRGWFDIESSSDLSGADPVQSTEPTSGLNTRAALSPQHGWLVVSELVDKDPGRGTSMTDGTGELLAGRVQSGTTELTALESSVGGDTPVAWDVRGWRDEDTAVVETYSQTGRRLVAIHLPDGAVRPMARFDQSDNSGVVFASGLLGSPVVDAVEPPHPWQPRTVMLVVGAAMLLLLLLLPRGLRRVRRRRARG